MENFGCFAQVRMRFQRGLDPHFIANQQEFEAIVMAAGLSRTVHHYAHAYISAHRINRDTRETH
jgi:hypothetical protein